MKNSAQPLEIRRGWEQMDSQAVADWLHHTYWAADRPDAVIRRSMEHSLCFGVFDTESGRQLAFARVITDYATSYYLCDVVVDPGCRGQGVGSLLLSAVTEDQVLAGLRGILATRDAHDFYRKFGFEDGSPLFMQTPFPFTEE